jgi:hypothetical protein
LKEVEVCVNWINTKNHKFWGFSDDNYSLKEPFNVDILLRLLSRVTRNARIFVGLCLIFRKRFVRLSPSLKSSYF